MMQNDNSAHLCRLDSSLDGIVNILPLEDINTLVRTGDKRLLALLGTSLRCIYSIDEIDLPSRLLRSNSELFRRVTSITIQTSTRSVEHNDQSLDATILPPLLTRLKATHFILRADNIQLDVEGKKQQSILPHLIVLQVLSFAQPLSLLSTALECVDIRSGFVDFEVDKPVQFNIRSLRIDFACLREAGILKQVLDHVLPSKMRIESLDSAINEAYFPPSLTDLTWRVRKWTKPMLLDILPNLPTGLTRFVILYDRQNGLEDTYNGFYSKQTLLETFRQHLPNLRTVIRNEEEEVLLENGECACLWRKIRAMKAAPIEQTDISEFMIFERVRQPSRFFKFKYFNVSTLISVIMRKFPALGYHMVRNLSLAEFCAVCCRPTFYGHDAVFPWIQQLEPDMFSDKNQFIARLIVLFRSVRCASLASDIVKNLEPRLPPSLFRVMLHLIWIIAYKPTTDERDFFGMVNDKQCDAMLEMLRVDYDYTGFISSNTQSFVVWSLRQNLFQSGWWIDCNDVAGALELMNDGALADAACRGLVDNDWFFRYGAWRTMQILKESVGDERFVLYSAPVLYNVVCVLESLGCKPSKVYSVGNHEICSVFHKLPLPEIYTREEAFEAVRIILANGEGVGMTRIICSAWSTK